MARYINCLTFLEVGRFEFQGLRAFVMALGIATCLSVVLGLRALACEPSDDEIRQFLSNTAFLTPEWRTSFDSIHKRFASEEHFSKRLIGFLFDGDKDVRKGVLHAVIELKVKEPKLAAPIGRILREDHDRWVRMLAVDALHSVGGKDSVSQLLSALDDKDANIRAETIQVLRREGLSSATYVARLGELLSDAEGYSYPVSADSVGSRPVKYEAVIALGEIGPKARAYLPKLRDILANDSNSDVRIAAAVALVQLDEQSKSAIRYLMDEAENASSEYLRSDAIQGLGRLGARAKMASPVLRRILRSDHSWIARSSAADVLPAVGGPGGDNVDALIEALADGDPWVQMAALESLETIGSNASRAVSAVQRLLDKYTMQPEDNLPYVNGDIRVQAIATMLAIGKRESVIPIINQVLCKVKGQEPRSRIQELLNRPDRPSGTNEER